MTDLDPVKLAAYQNAHYRVGVGRNAPRLIIDEQSELLRELYSQSNASSALFITAANPFGTWASQEENAAKRELLRVDLVALTPHVFVGEGTDPDETWGIEDSFLALGVSEAKAVELGTRYQQDAVVFASADAVPHLLLID